MFLANAPTWLAPLLQLATTPLRDAAAVSATRWVLFAALKKTGLPVQAGTGGRTKWNCSRLGLAKMHAFDAAGVVCDVHGTHVPILRATCTVLDTSCNTRLDQFDFPRAYRTR